MEDHVVFIGRELGCISAMVGQQTGCRNTQAHVVISWTADFACYWSCLSEQLQSTSVESLSHQRAITFE